MAESIIPIPRQVKDIAGQKFGRLSAVAYVGSNKRGLAMWECDCDCGARITAAGAWLRSGNTNSCGCLKRDNPPTKTHGMSKTIEYRIWLGMIKRCRNKSTPCFKNYGDRGIDVDKRWMAFERFYTDMGDRPSCNHSIERVDNSGPYSKDNCIWATKSVQCRNRRPRTNTGIAGIRKTKHGTYKAVINKTRLGTFKTIDEAIHARESAKAIHWG